MHLVDGWQWISYEMFENMFEKILKNIIYI